MDRSPISYDEGGLARPRVLVPVLERHFSELDILWERRENCVFDSEWRLRDLAELETRAALHLRGLRVGAGHSVDLAREALTGDEQSTATAAAFVLYDAAHELHAELLAVMEAAPAPVAHGVRVALRHRQIDSCEEALRAIVAHASPLACACAADVLAFHRRAQPDGVRTLLEHDDGDLRASALASLGRWRSLQWNEGELQEELTRSPRERTAALEAAATVGTTHLLEACRDAAHRATDPAPEAMRFLGVVAPLEEGRRMAQAIGHPVVGEAAILGLGALGSAESIPTLLEAMQEPRSAHACAAAFLRITGAPDMSSDEPIPPPPDLPEDEVEFWNERIDVDRTLAVAWWDRNRDRFAPGRQWQAGVDVTDVGVGAPLDELPLQTRRELYLRRCSSGAPSMPDLELESLALTQLRSS